MNSPSLIALLLLIAAASRSPAVANAQSTRSDAMRIAVAVHPICTVRVNPGEWSIEDAVDVACRNFRVNQPAPLVTGDHANGSLAADIESGDTVVINF
jgi:hypothetical protein